MRKLTLAVTAIVFALNFSYGQLKSQEPSQPSVAHTLVRPAGSLSGLLGWFNPANLMMRHNFSFQYFSSGGYGLSLATYTNSILYRIADPLDVRFDISLQGSPFGQYGAAQQGEFNRLFLSRAELNYRPWENVHVQFLFRQGAYGSYDFYSPHYFRSTPTTFGDE